MAAEKQKEEILFIENAVEYLTKGLYLPKLHQKEEIREAYREGRRGILLEERRQGSRWSDPIPTCPACRQRTRIPDNGVRDLLCDLVELSG